MYQISLSNEDQKPFVYQSRRISHSATSIDSLDEAKEIANYAEAIGIYLKVDPEFRVKKKEVIEETTQVAFPELESKELNRNQMISFLIKVGHSNEDLKTKTKVELAELVKLEESLG